MAARVRKRGVAGILFIGFSNGDALAQLRPGPCGVLMTAAVRWSCSTITSRPLFADSRQDRMDIAGELGFSKAECHLVLDPTESCGSLSCSRAYRPLRRRSLNRNDLSPCGFFPDHGPRLVLDFCPATRQCPIRAGDLSESGIADLANHTRKTPVTKTKHFLMKR
jgi:hypothetical protein